MYLQKRLNIELGEQNQQGKSIYEDNDDDENFWADHPEQTEIDKSNLPKKVTILPLYSQLNPDKQYRIFQTPKEDHRLIVLSTNVAETRCAEANAC